MAAAWTAAPSPMRYESASASRSCSSGATGKRGAGSECRLTRVAGPLRPRALGQVLPFDTDHVPVDHGPLLRACRRVLGRECVVGVVEIGSADSQNAAENDPKQQSHDEPPRPLHQNARLELPVPRSRGAFAAYWRSARATLAERSQGPKASGTIVVNL